MAALLTKMCWDSNTVDSDVGVCTFCHIEKFRRQVTEGYCFYNANSHNPDSEPGRGPAGIWAGQPSQPGPSPVWATDGIWPGFAHTTGWSWASPDGARLGFDSASPCPGESHGAQGCPDKSCLGSERARCLGRIYFTGEGQILRIHREVLPVADESLLLHTEVPFIEGKYLHLFTAKM